MSTDTIFALSSGQPPAGIGVIRISGPVASDVLRGVIGKLPKPRFASYVTMFDPQSRDPIDHGIALWFPGPRTATGEDLAELHCHGGRAVTAALLAMLARQPDCRLAEPGEFTRRAFLNGRIDLNEAEGLADLLLAETEGQRRAAMAMAQGHFSRRVEDWQRQILQLSALVEAALDFSDADDVPGEGTEAEIARRLALLQEDIRSEQSRPSAERLRDGVRVVIAGPPNAGKSTLLNALAGWDAAIVSDIAGTTRDRIEIPLALGGIAFLVTDTAGLRDDASDDVEAIGMGRAREAIDAADILLWLGDGALVPHKGALRIAAQADRPGWTMPDGTDIALSARTGQGMDRIVAALVDRAAALLPRQDGYALHARQRQLINTISDLLQDGLGETDMLIVAEILRTLRGAVDRLTGRSGTEDMLDALFGSFCIGK